MRLLQMTTTQYRAGITLFAVTCFATGVMAALVFVALVSIPAHDAEAARRVETAYAKGAMIKIASRPGKCREFALERNVARCVS